jgi:ribosomal protein S18 acetylase RimI-like enzyme
MLRRALANLLAMALAATATSLFLFLALWGKQIEGWATHGLAGRCRWTALCDLERPSRTRLIVSRSAATLPQDNSSQERSTSTPSKVVSIRESLHGDLGKCADVVMSAFYPTYKNPFKHLVRLAELSLLQQRFSYDKSQHVMYVATESVVDENSDSNNNMIVGFCDIDLRPPNRPMPFSYNPRPYLSDLCVHSEYRRRGIGRELLLRCEDFCVKAGKDRVYVRVEDNNTAAMDLYTRLGYVAVDNPDSFEGGILLLVKDLRRVSCHTLVGNTTMKDQVQIRT